MIARSASLLPQSALGHLGWLRGALGATIGIGVAALFTQLLLGANTAGLPWLVAPLGASAVLVFAVPASPLAQPWSVIGGNLISAAIGIGFGLGLGLGSAALAASLAVGTAIAVMIYARCLHPPGGACALLCALGASTQGWDFGHLWPILANVLALSFVGWFYNNLTGHQWPHHVELPKSGNTSAPVGHTRRDIEEVLTDWNEVLDVDVDDLDAFYQALERHVAKRRARPR
ncbi:HPP family protein [Altererythrobacter endophyticus]|uniref:HPP family protein n=1 Tax=Altericroceibacterium endophyticum TaxID=1808508 RepID=A0A6I4T8V2_9SPHN|nr:HPP family protein [Altericroceibacterium endophyticum]MXO67128.1 HPP family protein [Altericroceibacterium endophyticum]